MARESAGGHGRNYSRDGKTVKIEGLGRVANFETMTVSDLLNYFDRVEVWRPIVGYPGYEVSSWGNVRGKRVGLLKPSISKGYRHLSLSHEGLVKTEHIYRLVALAFIGPPLFDGAEIAHTDGDSSNDYASNLRWTNALDNQADVERHGNRCKGSMVYGAVLSEEHIPSIKKRALSGELYKYIAGDYGVSISTISLIKLGKIWRHV